MRDTTWGERRRLADRRRRPHWAEWRWLFGGRRRAARRAGEAVVGRLDWYPAPLFGVALLIVALSTLDAAFTLVLLERGLATEANPLMARLLHTDVRLFVGLKTALTGGSMLLLVLYSHARLLGALRLEHGLYGLLGLYLGIVGYELALIAQSGYGH